MSGFLPIAFKISIVIFLYGSLIDMGIRLDLKDAVPALKNIRFLLYTMVWGFVLGPALAYLLAHIIPMDTAYANGIILQGLTPCAPFVALLVDRVKGNLELTAALMLVSIAGTVIIMPIVLPFLVKGMAVTPWMIGRPVLLSIALPFVIGILLRAKAEAVAPKIQPFIKKMTGIAAIAIIVLTLVIYGKDFVASIGSNTNLALIIFLLILATVPYLLGLGLHYDEKIVLSIGITSRNIGAAIVPSIAIPGIDPRTTVVVLLSLLYMTIFALLTGKLFGRPAAAENAGG